MARKTTPNDPTPPNDARRDTASRDARVTTADDLRGLPPALRETVRAKIAEGHPDAAEGVSREAWERAVRRAARSTRPDSAS